MNILYNFLNQDVIDLAHREVESIRRKLVWGTSITAWDPVLTQFISPGACTFANVGDRLYQMVVDRIRPHVPVCNTITIKHYLWHPLSGIGIHSDPAYKFGATLYLNPRWEMEWGGLLVVKEKDVFIAYPPHFNTLIVNTTKQDHMVTTVSPLVPYPRHTLQIWGE